MAEMPTLTSKRIQTNNREVFKNYMQLQWHKTCQKKGGYHLGVKMDKSVYKNTESPSEIGISAMEVFMANISKENYILQRFIECDEIPMQGGMSPTSYANLDLKLGLKK